MCTECQDVEAVGELALVTRPEVKERVTMVTAGASIETPNHVIKEKHTSSMAKCADNYVVTHSAAVTEALDFPARANYPRQCMSVCSALSTSAATWAGWRLYTGAQRNVKDIVYSRLGGVQGAFSLSLVMAFECVVGERETNQYTHYALIDAERGQPKEELFVVLVHTAKPRPHPTGDDHVGVELQFGRWDYIRSARTDIPQVFTDAIEDGGRLGAIHAWPLELFACCLVYVHPTWTTQSIALRSLAVVWDHNRLDKLRVVALDERADVVNVSQLRVTKAIWQFCKYPLKTCVHSKNI